MILGFRPRPALLLVAIVSLAASGCTLGRMVGSSEYYRVTDPATGRVYVSDDLRKEGRGVVEFRDSASGAWVSLPAAEVKKISRAEFQAEGGD
jgi:hypothetical protein